MKRLLIILTLFFGVAVMANSASALTGGKEHYPGGQGYRNHANYYSAWGYATPRYGRQPHRHPRSYYYGYGNPSFGYSYYSPFYRGPGRTNYRGYSGVYGF